jgi:hypothetical protein
MKLTAIAVSAVLTFAAPGFSQQKQDNKPGAKQLFRDTSTGVSIVSGPEKRPPGRSGQPNNPAPQTPPASQKPNTDVTGLMYYVEVIQPSGQALRVNTTRIFHNGERIRFHVLSNVSGRLTILQSENDGAFLPLFPHPQLRGGDNRVEQGKETVIPMQFDNRPGNIRLMLMLVADGAAGSNQQTASNTAKPSGGNTPVSTTPQQTRPANPQTPVQTASNNGGSSSGRPQAPLTPEEIRAVLGKLSGSKALKIETDESPTEAARFTVVDRREDRDMPAGTVAVEVRLTHQP